MHKGMGKLGDNEHSAQSSSNHSKRNLEVSLGAYFYKVVEI